MLNPITTISQRLVTILERSNAFTSLAPKIVDMTDPQFQRFQLEVQPADLPEITIVQTAFQYDAWGWNSKISSYTQDFRFVVVMEDLRSPPLNQLKIATLAALNQGGPDLGLSGLVYKWEVKDGADDAFGPEVWTRDTIRFFAMFQVPVTFYLDANSVYQFGA